MQTQNLSKTKPQKKQSSSAKKKLILIMLGGIIGLLNGFFGGGGGMVCVPTLEKGLGIESKKAHATAIAVILPLSIVSSAIYIFRGQIASLPLLTVGLGVIFGGIAGSICLKFIPAKTLKIIFAILMFAGGIRLLI